jgi:hypothetical protein
MTVPRRTESSMTNSRHLSAQSTTVADVHSPLSLRCPSDDEPLHEAFATACSSSESHRRRVSGCPGERLEIKLDQRPSRLILGRSVEDAYYARIDPIMALCTHRHSSA